MDFWYVEMFSHANVDNDGFILVKGFESIFEGFQSCGGMDMKLREVDEINDCYSHPQYSWLYSTLEYSDENTLHFFVLLSCPLWHKWDPFFEVP